VGFVVDEVALRSFLRVLTISPVNMIPPWLSIFIYNLVDEQQARWWLQFRDVQLGDQELATARNA
jgi:hypothetical protein